MIGFCVGLIEFFNLKFLRYGVQPYYVFILLPYNL